MSLTKVARLSDDEAFNLFKEIRWASNNGDPVCPVCGHKECWSFKSRKIFKCRKCSKQFSVTSELFLQTENCPSEIIC